MVDQADQCSSGETHSVSSPSVGHLHRCLHQRLGSPLQQSISSSSVVSYRDNSTHHRVGAASHSEGCPPPSDQRKGSDDLLGQQLSSCLTPESGGGGGTQSLPIFHLTWEILLECQLQGITLLVRHIPDCLNVLSDGLSRRDQIIGTEWSMHPSMVRQMFSISFMPKMDLFATHHNNKLTEFVSPVRDPRQ